MVRRTIPYLFNSVPDPASGFGCEADLSAPSDLSPACVLGESFDLGLSAVPSRCDASLPGDGSVLDLGSVVEAGARRVVGRVDGTPDSTGRVVGPPGLPGKPGLVIGGWPPRFCSILRSTNVAPVISPLSNSLARKSLSI